MQNNQTTILVKLFVVFVSINLLNRFGIKANTIPELKSIVRILMELQKVLELQDGYHNRE